MKILRIVFTILSAICVAAAVPLGILLDFPYALGAALFALLFFGVVLLIKNRQDAKETKDNPPADFISGNSDANTQEK